MRFWNPKMQGILSPSWWDGAHFPFSKNSADSWPFEPRTQHTEILVRGDASACGANLASYPQWQCGLQSSTITLGISSIHMLRLRQCNGQSSPKGQMTCYPSRLPSCQILSPWVNKRRRYVTSTKNSANKQTNKQVRQLSGLAYIPTCRSPWNTNSLQHRPSPSKRRPVCQRVRDGRASLSHRPNDSRSCYQFSNFLTSGAYPWAKGHQKRRWPTVHLDLPSYKISTRSRQRSTILCVTKIFQFLTQWD